MAANLLGAEPSAIALDQGAHYDGDQQPGADAERLTGGPADGGSRRSSSRLTYRAGLSILVVTQLAWIALLVYAAYWIGARL